MKMPKQKTNLCLSVEAYEMLCELGRVRSMKHSAMIEKWIKLSYEKYTKKKEKSKDETIN